MKHCQDCKIEKNEREFYRRPNGRLYSWCRDCQTARYVLSPDSRDIAVEFRGAENTVRSLVGRFWAHRIAKARKETVA